MTHQTTLFAECPLCNQGAVVWQDDAVYYCDHCGLTLKERAVLGVFRKGHYGVSNWGEGDFSLAAQSLKGVALSPSALQIALGNAYPDAQLAALAGGALTVVRPVRTVLAQIILEQLNETCYLQVNGLRRAQGQPIAEGGIYLPVQASPRSGLEWQDRGNLFCTDQRLVFPSDRFTIIRFDRKLVGVQAFTNGLALQRQGETFATYFVGSYAHEAALVAAYIMAKVPALRVQKT
jgi:ribosomal protein S27AE